MINISDKTEKLAKHLTISKLNRNQRDAMILLATRSYLRNEDYFGLSQDEKLQFIILNGDGGDCYFSDDLAKDLLKKSWDAAMEGTDKPYYRENIDTIINCAFSLLSY